MAQEALDLTRDYSRFRRIDLSGDHPSVAGATIRDRLTGDSGDLGYVIRAGYYYNATYNDYITSDLPNTQFIHGAFNYSATSGSARGAYLITKFSGAGAVSGECLRVRTTVSAAQTGGANHGIHAESRLLAGGSQSGMTAGIRATLAAEATSGLTTGTHHSLRLDSDLALTSTAANASFLGVYDVNGTNKMPYFAIFDASCTAAIVADTSNVPEAATYKIRCKAGSTDFYLIGVADF